MNLLDCVLRSEYLFEVNFFTKFLIIYIPILNFRLWNKFKEFDNIQRIRDKIELVTDMNSHGKVQVDSLSDSPVKYLLQIH